MPFLKLAGNLAIVAFNKNIYFVNKTTNWSYKVDLNAPPEKGHPRKYFDADSGSEEDVCKLQDHQNKEINEEKINIVSAEVHETILAVSTSDKSLLLYESEDFSKAGSLKLLSRRFVARTTSCMKFAGSGEFIVVCDKGGDCYAYDCKDFTKPGQWLFGHMSQVLDVLINPDESLIITSERDEKIRVTRCPESHNIETFCLGHTEFVSHLEFLATSNCSLLLSLSGDKTLRVWEYKTGKELFRKELKLPGTKLTTKLLHDGSTLAVVLCYKPNTLAVYRIIIKDTFRCEFIQKLNTAPNIVLSTITFDNHFNLLALTIEEDTSIVALKMYDFDQEKNIFNIDYVDYPSETFVSCLKDERLPYVDSVSFLFKKKFDNIKDYHERKRKRCEENSK
ncbi:tRNA (guanine-N(7)-)-methyltransferase non-catalytic subunit wuho [Topomyia yanbarensis]|uniref:tRNA (guanine-N(7)-)-methyltransferase non-catalytic subunit wuho n=1 Tax=Topomyia yanbarensis TaxID=2498891 RepID=UPI00273C6BC8|nr:tRNA (guanine-N(7)-)-methyltransferase non-catalytic subunit wuho [Topomyia yanbarensis]